MFADLLYAVALVAASPLVVYRMLRFGRYRRGAWEKLVGLSPYRSEQLRGGASRCLWLHAVSVGEVNLLPGVVKRLRDADPAAAFVISTTTDSGYDLAVEHFGREHVFFCPLDFSWAVRRTFRHLRPEALVLAELELWPNLIRAAERAGCQVLVINGRLSNRSAARYQRLARLTQNTFARLSWVGCQDPSVAERFAACGTRRERLEVTGSLKFDGAPSDREAVAVEARAAWSGVEPWHRVWVLGSSQAGEEQMVLQLYQRLRCDCPELRLVVVPRHRERFALVANLIQRHGLKVHRRSQDGSCFDGPWDNDRVILVDTIGELKHWWGISHIATVGGSFGDRGGQNPLEPAGYGAAVSFGPDMRNFLDIADRLLTAGGAVQVTDADQLESFVRRCLTDYPAADALGRAARQWVDRHRGATETTVRAICRRTGPGAAAASRRAA